LEETLEIIIFQMDLGRRPYSYNIGTKCATTVPVYQEHGNISPRSDGQKDLSLLYLLKEMGGRVRMKLGMLAVNTTV
jgi:hypothetical protein